MITADLIVEIIDSTDDPSTSFVVVGNCRVEVRKDKLGNFCYIVHKLEQKCGLKLDEENTCRE